MNHRECIYFDVFCVELASLSKNDAKRRLTESFDTAVRSMWKCRSSCNEKMARIRDVHDHIRESLEDNTPDWSHSNLHIEVRSLNHSPPRFGDDQGAIRFIVEK